MFVVPQVRIELTTYRLQGGCSASELQGLKLIVSQYRYYTANLEVCQPIFLLLSNHD